jgi:hypothetical protein
MLEKEHTDNKGVLAKDNYRTNVTKICRKSREQQVSVQ